MSESDWGSHPWVGRGKETDDRVDVIHRCWSFFNQAKSYSIFFFVQIELVIKFRRANVTSRNYLKIFRIASHLATSTSSASRSLEIPNFCSAVSKASSKLWVWLLGCNWVKSSTSGRWLWSRALKARPSRHEDVKSWRNKNGPNVFDFNIKVNCPLWVFNLCHFMFLKKTYELLIHLDFLKIFFIEKICKILDALQKNHC